MAIEYGTYSFVDVQVTLTGPGGTFSIGGGTGGVSDEGITMSMVGPKDVMTMGADGSGMHSLIASKAAKIEISLLKTAPGNNILSYLYNFQSASSANWGQNQITIQNPVTGDSITLLGGAFEKQADIAYKSQGGMNVWPFLFVERDDILGNGGQVRALIPTTS